MAEPPTHLAVLMVIVGVIMLAGGASWLVDGASRLAARLGVPPLLVGLTVVGFGTSTPELSVSLVAALRGSGGLSLGNAVGSNIMNLLLVLGAAALVRPMHVRGSRGAVARDLLLGLVPAGILVALAWNGRITRSTALLLLAVFAVALAVWLVAARGADGDAPRAPAGGSALRHLAFSAAGIAVLVLGAELLVRGGATVARSLGVSEAVIGLSLVALGTSLPELATAVTAAVKGETELSVGNVLGSNVFNLGLIVGSAFSLSPAAVPVFVVRQDVPLLVLATVVVGGLVLRGGRLSRRSAVVLLGLFVAYLAFLGVRGG